MAFKNKSSAIISRAIGIIIVVSSCFFLTESIINTFFLKKAFVSHAEVGFFTSVGFLVSGFSLYLLSPSTRGNQLKLIANFSAGIILVIGIANLSANVFFSNYLQNENLLSHPGHNLDTFFEPMSLIGSFSFALLGIIFLSLGKKRFRWPLQLLFIILVIGPLLVMLSYYSGTVFLNSIPELNGMPFATAALFLILFAGIFFSPAVDYANLPFMNKIVGFFILVVVMRGVIFFAISQNSEQAASDNRDIEQTRGILLTSEKIRTAVAEIQNETTEILVSDDQNRSSRFDDDNRSLNDMVTSLRSLSNAANSRQFLIDSLAKQVALFVAIENKLFAIRDVQVPDVKRLIVQHSIGEGLPARINRSLRSIDLEANQFLSESKAKSALTIFNASRLLKVLQIVVIVLITIALRMIYNNIKFRNKIENDLKNSLKDLSDYKYALDQSSIVAIMDENGIIKEVNDNFCKVSKFKKEELLGKRYAFSISGCHSETFLQDLRETIVSGNVWRGELKNKAKDESYYWLDTTIVPFLDERGKPCQYVTICSDITQKKELEERIRHINEVLQKSVAAKTAEIVEKEQQYQFFFQNMREGIQVIGFDWRYLFVNDSMARQSKYTNEELLGLTVMERNPGIENTLTFSILQSCMKNRLAKIIEDEFILPDGTTACLELSIQPVPEGLLIISMDITERKKAAKDLITERLKQQELITETIVAAQKEEKIKLGRELHDNINQILATVKMCLGMAKSGKNMNKDLVSKSYDYVADAMKEIRILSHSLAAPCLEESNLEKALQGLVEDINLLNDLKVQLLIEGNDLELDKEKELTCFRIVQEQLSNIIKYAQAKTVIIKLQMVNHKLSLSVIDDGVGFDTLQQSGGIGLKNIKSRIDFYGGNMKIVSSPGKGCAVEVSVPHVIS